MIPRDRRPLRLAMVSANYLPHTGGVELHVDEVARRLVKRGVDTTVLTTDRTGALPSDESVDGVRVVRVRAWPASRDYHIAPAVYSEIVRGEYDLVHVQSYHTFVAPIAMSAARRTRVPYVVTFHGGGHSSRLRHRLRPLQLALLRPLLAGADRLIALTRSEAKRYGDLLRLSPDQFAVIPNGSDLPRLRPSTSSRDELLASVGRLERYKGHHRVLAALPHIVSRRPRVRLWIAGSGPYETELKALADRLTVSDRVEFRAVAPERRAEMARDLAKVAVVVLLSEFETQPIAALEALSVGCRLVVADSDGLRELGEDGLARIVPLESSPEDVAAAVLEELDRPGVAEPPELPSWDDCAESLLALYRTVIDAWESRERPTLARSADG